MDFGVYVDLLAIEYDTINCFMKPYINNTIKMLKISNYEWYMGQKTVENFRKFEFGMSQYSNNFADDCWCLVASPKGVDEWKRNVFRLSVKLLRLPFDLDIQ